MRLSATTFILASLLPLPNAIALPGDRMDDITILQYDIDAAYTRFAVASRWLSTETQLEADESLVFDLQVNPTSDILSTDTILNGERLEDLWNGHSGHSVRSTQLLNARDTFGRPHSVNVSSRASITLPTLNPFRPETQDGTQTIQFRIWSVDGQPTANLAFTVISQPTAPRRLRQITLLDDSRSVDFSQFEQSFMLAEPSDAPVQDAMPDLGDDDDNFDVASESELLADMEAEAEELHAKIVAKKNAIQAHLKDHRDHVPLKHLLEECDSLVCAARVLAQRICDKVGSATQHSRGYRKTSSVHLQRIMSSGSEGEQSQPALRKCNKTVTIALSPTASSSTSVPQQASNMELLLTKNETTSEHGFYEIINPPNALVRVLQVLAAALGLVALYSYIRLKCMSVRTRVERAADREERQNARAYRRAARKALMRQRWESFVKAIDCFGKRSEPRMEDYEEKRALILQDAFLEQMADMEAAEKGEVMEAEIRELRHAHEIVASLVRVGADRYDLVRPVNDPPPPRVPLPYTPANRSRASTNTLPSYWGESLPDYSSRPATLFSGNSSVGNVSTHDLSGFSSDSEEEDAVPPPSMSCSGRIGYTPTSSVIDTSPRISAETMRTRLSKEA